jgi:hypothetical protein
MFKGEALMFVKKQFTRLKSANYRDFLRNIYNFSQQVRQIESDNNPKAAAKTTSAKGVYQFTDASVQTGKNRMYNMGFEKEFIREVDNNPHNWTDEQADSIFLANIFAQRGSDNLLRKIGYGDIEARKQSYYKFHHTKPDTATKDRVNNLMISEEL